MCRHISFLFILYFDRSHYVYKNNHHCLSSPYIYQIKNVLFLHTCCVLVVNCDVLYITCVCIENTREKCTCCVVVVYLLCTGCVLLVYCDVLLLYITLCMYREHEREMSNFLKLIELFRENRIVLLKMKQVKKMLKNAKQNFSSILARKQTCLTTPYREHHKNQDSKDSCMR